MVTFCRTSGRRMTPDGRCCRVPLPPTTPRSRRSPDEAVDSIRRLPNLDPSRGFRTDDLGTYSRASPWLQSASMEEPYWIQVRRRVHGRSTSAGVRRLAVGQRRGGRSLRSGLWRAGLASCPSMLPSRRTGTATVRPSLPRAPGIVDILWRGARRWGRRQHERSGAGRRCGPRGGSIVASRSSSRSSTSS
jgi:hypothetical protein